MVGGRQTMVGLASGTSRSMVNFLRPVTAASASIRLWGRPMTLKPARGASSTLTCRVLALAALTASAPMSSRRPDGATTAPPSSLSSAAGTPSSAAAAFRSRSRATEAATRIGVYVETVVFEPPVSWLNSSSGRASASVTRTRSRGTASSSAISMAVEVVMPCPTSARGSAKETMPSVPTSTEIRFEVGRAAAVMTSLRSRSSVRSGEGSPAAAAASGEAATAGVAAGAEGTSSAAATRVGAATT